MERPIGWGVAEGGGAARGHKEAETHRNFINRRQTVNVRLLTDPLALLICRSGTPGTPFCVSVTSVAPGPAVVLVPYVNPERKTR